MGSPRHCVSPHLMLYVFHSTACEIVLLKKLNLTPLEGLQFLLSTGHKGTSLTIKEDEIRRIQSMKYSQVNQHDFSVLMVWVAGWKWDGCWLKEN